MRHDVEAVLVEQGAIFVRGEARVIERLAVKGADPLASCGPLLNIRAASGAACARNAANIAR